MEISIKYCVQWDYLPTARSLAGKIKDKLGVDAKLIHGAGGVFDVMVDGELIYSRAQTGRFPDEDKLVALIKV